MSLAFNKMPGFVLLAKPARSSSKELTVPVILWSAVGRETGVVLAVAAAAQLLGSGRGSLSSLQARVNSEHKGHT